MRFVHPLGVGFSRVYMAGSQGDLPEGQILEEVVSAMVECAFVEVTASNGRGLWKGISHVWGDLLQFTQIYESTIG